MYLARAVASSNGAQSPLGGPVSSLLGNGGNGQCRAHLSTEILATRRKQSAAPGDGCSVVTRPASLFVKRSPVPARRPLRYIPLSSISTNNPEEDEDEEEDDEEEEEVDGGRLAKAKKPEPVQVKKKSDRVSKWASLFEAANGSGSSGSSTVDTNDNTDAWFDKIFPKNPAGASSSPSSKLSAQQEKSIQQLQSLVKTLGVATKNPPPPARKNKPSKIRQLPVEGGGVVDPVPFASILKKLQSVSSLPGRLEQRSRVEQELERPKVVEEQEEEEEELGNEEQGLETLPGESRGSTRIEESSNSAVEEEEEKVFSKRSAVEEINDLAKLTVPTLRGMAKSRGLSGYSRLKKDDLVHLLTSSNQK